MEYLKLTRLIKCLNRLFIFSILLQVSGMSWAQEGIPTYVQVRFVEVKPSSVAEFETAITDIGNQIKAAGHPFFHVYETVRGDSGYAIFTLDPFYNELPQAEVGVDLIARVTSTQNSTRLITLAFYPELGIPVGDSVAPSGEFMTVRVRTTSPSNQQAFFDWHANEFTPALREAGWTDLRMARTVAGGNINTFVKFTFSDEYPADVSAIVERVGVNKMAQLVSREQELSVNQEDYIQRFRADLSFTAE